MDKRTGQKKYAPDLSKCVCEPWMPCNGHFFENCDVDIWPWQMTLTLKLRKGFHQGIYMWSMKALSLAIQKLWPMYKLDEYIHYKKGNLCINPFPNKPWILRVCSVSLLKTLQEKEKLLIKSNFSFSHSVFYPSGEISAILIKLKIVVCKFFLLKSLKLVVWERVKGRLPSKLFWQLWPEL